MRYRRSASNCAPVDCAGVCVCCLGGRQRTVVRSTRGALCVRARPMPNTMTVQSPSYCCMLSSDENVRRT
eukprot:3993849-Prymnesium_polylepis.1